MKTMMQRFSERLAKELKAELILNGHRYNVTIENFSENGIKVISEPNNTAVGILSDEIVDLEFEIPSGEVLSLHCKVKWSSKRSSDSIIEDIGLEITENSPEYEDLFKSLLISNMLYL
jgi:hypothetical protein